MNVRRPFTLLSLSILLFAQMSMPRGWSALPEATSGLTAAVLNFQTTGDNLQGKGTEAAVLLNAQLSQAAPDLILVERQELEKVLGEQELGLSGTVAPDTAAKIGSLTGAKVLVTGRLFTAGDKFFLAAKVIGTETSRVYGETVSFDDLGALDKGAAELAAKIGADIQKHADVLVAKVDDAGEHLQRLKKLVAGKTLPSVSVTITEQHIGQFVVDPAAQTEMKLVLQQLGCEVIEPSATGRRADVQITGEAFSESAGRRGNLLSDRARVEIKVIRPATGKLLLADRQTDTAVDLAENIAGKTALQNATTRLLDRLVPTLIEP